MSMIGVNGMHEHLHLQQLHQKLLRKIRRVRSYDKPVTIGEIVACRSVKQGAQLMSRWLQEDTIVSALNKDLGTGIIHLVGARSFDATHPALGAPQSRHMGSLSACLSKTLMLKGSLVAAAEMGLVASALGATCGFFVSASMMSTAPVIAATVMCGGAFGFVLGATIAVAIMLVAAHQCYMGRKHHDPRRMQHGAELAGGLGALATIPYTMAALVKGFLSAMSRPAFA